MPYPCLPTPFRFLDFKPPRLGTHVSDFLKFGEGVDSARGATAIVVCCRSSSCNSSCDAIQKNPRVRKSRVRNSGARNGCANFMGAWKKCVLSARKPMSPNPPELAQPRLSRVKGGGATKPQFGH